MIEPITLTAALLAGLLGSGHCIGMCGPIAALPSSNSSNSSTGNAKPLRRTVLYNSGRLLSYAGIGGLFGGLGYALGSAAQVAQWGMLLRVGLGVMLLLIGLQMIQPRLRVAAIEKFGGYFWQRVAPLAHRLKPAENSGHLFALGLLWGWLPCGLVYTMLALAAVSGSAVGGASTMLVFGVGTLPAMLGVGLAGSIGGRSLLALKRPTLRRCLGLGLVIGGIWTAAMPLQHAVMTAAGQHQHAFHDAMLQSFCHTIPSAPHGMNEAGGISFAEVGEASL